MTRQNLSHRDSEDTGARALARFDVRKLWDNRKLKRRERRAPFFAGRVVARGAAAFRQGFEMVYNLWHRFLNPANDLEFSKYRVAPRIGNESLRRKLLRSLPSQMETHA